MPAGCRHMVGLEGSTWAARRDASGLHVRPGHSIRPRGYRRFRLTRAKHDPPGRCRVGRVGRRCCRRRRGCSDLSRSGPPRQRQISGFGCRRGGIALDGVFGSASSRSIRLQCRQARYFRGKAEDALWRLGAGPIGRLRRGRVGGRRLRRQASRHPMARSRGLGLPLGIPPYRIAAIARRRCALRVHRPSPTLTPAIAAITTSNSAIDRRIPQTSAVVFAPRSRFQNR